MIVRVIIKQVFRPSLITSPNPTYPFHPRLKRQPPLNDSDFFNLFHIDTQLHESATHKMANVVVKREPSPPPERDIRSPRYSPSPSTPSVIIEREVILRGQGSGSLITHGLPLPPPQTLVGSTCPSVYFRSLIRPRLEDQ